MLTYTILQQDSRTTVTLDGDVDIDGTEVMQDEIAGKLSSAQHIELDFANVPFVDSSGIGLLISLIQDLQAKGKQVVITRLSSDVQQVFMLLQIPDILGIRVFADFQQDGDR